MNDRKNVIKISFVSKFINSKFIINVQNQRTMTVISLIRVVSRCAKYNAREILILIDKLI